jgi:hypothetical protein
MDTLSSSEFRKTFARLLSPTLVQVNGHTIGTWLPGESIPASVAAPELAKRPGGLPPVGRSVDGLDHSRNNTPFTPMPKR